MADLFAKKNKGFELEVKAYGFREMPDKLGVALRTGEGIPDMVQLDETFFGVFLNGPSPFLNLTNLAKKAKLDKTLHPRRLEVFTYKDSCLAYLSPSVQWCSTTARICSKNLRSNQKILRLGKM